MEIHHLFEGGRSWPIRYYHPCVRCDRMKNGRGMTPVVIYAGVVELVDSMDLGSITLVVCGFESRRPHHAERSYST